MVVKGHNTIFSMLFAALSVLLLALVLSSTFTSYKRDRAIEAYAKQSVVVDTVIAVSSDLRKLLYLTENNTIYPSSQRQSEIVLAIQDANAELSKLTTLSEQLPEDNILRSVIALKNTETISEVLDKMLERQNSGDQNIEDLTLVLEPLAQEVDSWAGEVHQIDRNFNEGFKTVIRRESRSSVFLNSVMVLLSFLAMGYFIFINYEGQKLAVKNQQIIESVEKSSRAKSRLLSMLSHELRTPMNGLLGLIALGLQSKNSPPQQKILEQIRASAMELFSFLEDMLNFSSLDKGNEKGNMCIIIQPLFVSRLQDRLASVLRRHNVVLTVDSEDARYTALSAEKERMLQALFYGFSFIAKNTFETEIRCTTRVYEGQWFWKVDLKMSESDGTKWHIESLAGEQNLGDHYIESDTIETTMFRGLVENLGGSIVLKRAEPSQKAYRLIIGFPISNLENKEFGLIDFSENQKLTPWISNMFQDLNFEFLERSSLSNADFIFLDTNMSNELESVKVIRRVAPKTPLIGVGNTSDASIYDAHLSTTPELRSPRQFQIAT